MNLTPSEQVWSRQLAVLHVQSEHEWRGAKRLEHVSEGEGAEAWKAFSEYYEPKTATRYAGMFRQILLYNFGELSSTIGPNNSGISSGITRNRAASQ